MSTMKNIGYKSDNLGHQHLENVKGSSDPRYQCRKFLISIFDINVGKSRIRHTTTQKLNNEFVDRLKID